MPHSAEIGRLRDVSEKRLNAVWGLLEIRTPAISDILKADKRELDKYGLGNKRTIEQFWAFCGVDAIAQNITVFDKSLWSDGGLERVPWNPPHIDPVLNAVVS